MYLLEELQLSSPTSSEFDMPSVIIKKEKKYIPPMSHPYKYASFQKYAEKQSHLKNVEIEHMNDSTFSNNTSDLLRFVE